MSCIILDYKSLKFKHFINNIAIDLGFSRNLASIEDVRKKKCNLMVDLSKFTFNKKILSGVVVISYNQVCSQTLSQKINTLWVRLVYKKASQSKSSQSFFFL